MYVGFSGIDISLTCVSFEVGHDFHAVCHFDVEIQRDPKLLHVSLQDPRVESGVVMGNLHQQCSYQYHVLIIDNDVCRYLPK